MRSHNVNSYKILLFTATFTALLYTPHHLTAQTFKVDTIRHNGSASKFINLVFLGDGFKVNELDTFSGSVHKSSDYFMTVSPFMNYRNYFNVFAIKVRSEESGADHPRSASDCPPESSHPKLVVDTYFSSTFDYANIHRLLTATNNQAINSVIMNNLPLADQKIMLVNTNYYGGSGGSVATCSLDPGSEKIVMHESGHSFAHLCDEYWAGDVYAREGINMTRETDPNLVKWKNWLGTDEVGIYPYGTAGTEAVWFRPHQKCLMQALSYPFCPVCKEAIVLEILKKFGNPVSSFYPEQQNLTVSGENLRFSLTLYKPDPNTLRTRWFLNGKIIAMNTDSLTLNPDQLISGYNALSVQVLDTTALIRSASHASINTFTTNWIVNNKVSASEDKMLPGTLKIYPNPVTDKLIISYGGSHKNTRFDIINTLGQVVLTGSFSGRKVIDASSLVLGTYWVILDNALSVEFLKL